MLNNTFLRKYIHPTLNDLLEIKKSSNISFIKKFVEWRYNNNFIKKVKNLHYRLADDDYTMYNRNTTNNLASKNNKPIGILDLSKNNNAKIKP